MNLCSSGHDEICYTGRHCPLCNAQDEIRSLNADLERALQQ